MLLKLVLPILLLKMRLNRKSKIVYMTYTCGICYITIGSAVVYLQKYVLCVTRNREHSYVQDCFSLMTGTSPAAVTVDGYPYWLVVICWSEPPSTSHPTALSLWI